MIKVFLVEDEVIIRKGVKNNIPWEKEGLEFVGEAGDGELAWPLIKQTQPDILITDIRMPFMDGLELSGLVRKELPGTKIILLSGYGEFDYAKKAISLGVTDYLLKPINSQKLLEAVKKVAETIHEERKHLLLIEQSKKEKQEHIAVKKKRLFNKIVSGTCSARELLDEGQNLLMDLTSSFYTVLLAKLMISDENTNYCDHLADAAEKVAAAVAEIENIITFERGLEGWAFLIKTEDKEHVFSQIHTFEKNLKQILTAYPEIQYFGGIGETVQRMSDIRRSYQTANKAFSSRFFIEKNQFINADKIAQIHLMNCQKMIFKTANASKINRNLVESFLKSGVVEEVSDFVEEYFHNIGKEYYESVMFCHYLIVDMNLCACQFLESIGINPDLLSKECRDINQFSSYMNSSDNMMIYVRKLFVETIHLRDKLSKNKYQQLIETAQKYIMDNFQNNEFSLNQAAAMVNLSPSYFSTLFRQEVGMTFVEYLTEVRLEKAKALLMCTNMRSSEIGYAVGYRDSHYFSYIFKKICGCTPKEYRTGKREV